MFLSVRKILIVLVTACVVLGPLAALTACGKKPSTLDYPQ